MIENIAQRIDGNNRRHLQFADLNGINAQPAFHRPIHTAQLADRRARARAKSAAHDFLSTKRRLARRAPHRRIGSNARAAVAQVIYIALHHNRNERHSCVVADLLEPTHHAVGRRQTVRRAARKHDRIDGRRIGHRRYDGRLTRCRSSAAYFDADRRSLRKYYRRHAGFRPIVLRVADEYSLQIPNVYFPQCRRLHRRDHQQHSEQYRREPRLDHIDPSNSRLIKLFISTAYSSGNSFAIGSTKPRTIIARASFSSIPRAVR